MKPPTGFTASGTLSSNRIIISSGAVTVMDRGDERLSAFIAAAVIATTIFHRHRGTCQSTLKMAVAVVSTTTAKPHHIV